MGGEPLADRIGATRLTYPEREGGGVGIDGAPFVLEFADPVAPESFCDAIRTAEDPWRLFGLTAPISDADYWKLVGTLYHVDGGSVVGSSKLTLEVCPEWCRVYVKADADAERVAAFVRAVDAEYGVDVRFGDDE